jgi:hypothetical protein
MLRAPEKHSAGAPSVPLVPERWRCAVLCQQVYQPGYWIGSSSSGSSRRTSFTARGPKATPEGRYNSLSNRIFRDHDDLVDHCCHAWNRLVAQPWRIMSIGIRNWAHRF